MKEAYNKARPLTKLDNVEQFLADIENFNVPGIESRFFIDDKKDKENEMRNRYRTAHSNLDMKAIWKRDATLWNLENCSFFGKYLITVQSFRKRYKIYENNLEGNFKFFHKEIHSFNFRCKRSRKRPKIRILPKLFLD